MKILSRKQTVIPDLHVRKRHFRSLAHGLSVIPGLLLASSVVLSEPISGSSENWYYLNDAHTQSISGWDRFSAEQFGSAIDSSSRFLIAGASRNNSLGIYAGTAYIFDRVDRYDGCWVWDEGQQIFPHEEGYQRFGEKVAITDTHAFVVSSPIGKDPLVHIFKYNDGGWEKQTVLSIPTSLTKIDARDDLLIVSGRSNDDDLYYPVGKVFVYRNIDNQWTLEDILESDEPARDTMFGHNFAIGTDQLAINESGTKLVHIFDYKGSEWSRTQKLTTERYGGFGKNLLFAGDDLAVSISNTLNSIGQAGKGGVLIYSESGQNGWQEVDSLWADIPNGTTTFARNGIYGDSDTLVIDDSDVGNGGGATNELYIFEKNSQGWERREAVKLWEGESYLKNMTVTYGDGVLTTAHPNFYGEDGAGYVWQIEDPAHQWDQKERITGSESAWEWQFGSEIARSGNRLVAFQKGYNRQGRKLYLMELEEPTDSLFYEKGGVQSTEPRWIELDVVSYGTDYGSLGKELAIDGDWVAVSGKNNEVDIYYIKGKRLNFVDTLVGSAGFGSSFAFENDYLYVGESRNSEKAEDSGAVHVYQLINGNWTFVNTIYNPGGNPDEHFGAELDVEGGILVSSAPGSYGTNNSGAYLFYGYGSQWTYYKKLLPAGNDIASFGASLDLDSGLVLVGSPDEGKGKAYVFRTSNGSLAATLEPENSLMDWPGFGEAVTLGEEYAAVGRPRDGQVYIWKRRGNSFELEAHLGREGEFGKTLNSYGNELLIGAPQNHNTDYRSGSLYYFIHD